MNTWFYLHCFAAVAILWADATDRLEPAFNAFEQKMGLYTPPDTIDDTPPPLPPPNKPPPKKTVIDTTRTRNPKRPLENPEEQPSRRRPRTDPMPQVGSTSAKRNKTEKNY